MHTTTKEWLMSLLIMHSDNCITRNGILWKYVAGFSQCGCVFAIYQNDNNYCFHSIEGRGLKTQGSYLCCYIKYPFGSGRILDF